MMTKESKLFMQSYSKDIQEVLNLLIAKEFLTEANKNYKPSTAKPKPTTTAEDTAETTVVSNNNMGVLKNVGKPIERKPLTPWESYIQALIMSNEFVYFN